MVFLIRDNGLLTSAETEWPRVSQRVYEGVFIAYLPIIVIATLLRLGIKLKTQRKLEIDDGFLLLALCCSLVAWAFVWQMRDLIYLQMEMVLNMKEIEPEDLSRMVVYSKWYNASMVLTWLAVYSVKLSFMFFFRKLISLVRSLEIYWWTIMGALIPTAIFSAFFSFWICTDFSMTYLSNCPLPSMMYREEAYLYATTALDIFTDILVISLPIILLSKVNISHKRKIILGIALCLSIFMIFICIIRVTTCKLSNGIIDSTWLGLWQCIETNTAILMVPLTAFRSLYCKGELPSYIAPEKTTKRPLWPSIRTLRMLARNQKMQECGPEDYCVLPEKPRLTVPFIRRGATQEEIDNQLLPSLDMTLETLESTITSERGRNPCCWPSRTRDTGELEAEYKDIDRRKIVETYNLK